MADAVILKFHTVDADEGRALVAEAIDLETKAPVACYSLAMMRAWLKREGYAWRTGSSGIWERAA